MVKDQISCFLSQLQWSHLEEYRNDLPGAVLDRKAFGRSARSLAEEQLFNLEEFIEKWKPALDEAKEKANALHSNKS